MGVVCPFFIPENKELTMQKFELNENTGMYQAHSVSEKDIIDMALKIAEQSVAERVKFTSATAAKDYIRVHLMGLDTEVFGMISLTSQHDIISIDTLFEGTINSANVYPREVVKKALSLSASRVMFFHNHPSGCPQPSQADISITKRLVDALDMIDIKTLDHFIVAKSGTVSLAERGLI